MQSLCTLRSHCRQWPRNTRYQAGATPYLGRTSTGWIAPACLAHSFHQLVGARQNRWGYGETERLRGLEVQDHLELGRQLHGEIARFLAAQNAIDISGGTAKRVYLVDSVGEQTAVSGKGRYRIDRQYVSGRGQYDRRATRRHECIRHDDKAAS